MSARRGAARFVVLLAVVASLGAACSRDGELRCRSGSRYLEADSADPLRVPDDLSVPDEDEALQIPPPTAPSGEADDEGCLEYSPAFSVEEPEED